MCVGNGPSAPLVRTVVQLDTAVIPSKPKLPLWDAFGTLLANVPQGRSLGYVA